MSSSCVRGVKLARGLNSDRILKKREAGMRFPHRIIIVVLAGLLLALFGEASAQSGDLRRDLQAYQNAVSQGKDHQAAVLASHLAIADYSASPFTAAEIREVKFDFAQKLWTAGYRDRAIFLLDLIIREDKAAVANTDDPVTKGIFRAALSERLELIGSWLSANGALANAVRAYRDAHAERTGILGNDHGIRDGLAEYPGQIPHSYVISLRDQDPELNRIYGYMLNAQAHPNMAELTAELVALLRRQAQEQASRGDAYAAIKTARLAYFHIQHQCGRTLPSLRGECNSPEPFADDLSMEQVVKDLTEYYQILSRQLEQSGDLVGAASALHEASIFLGRYSNVRDISLLWAGSILSSNVFMKKQSNKIYSFFRLPARQSGRLQPFIPAGMIILKP